MSEPPAVPGAADEQYSQGIAALKRRRFPEAVRIFSEAVAAHPDNASLHFLLGKAQLLTGDPQHAIPTLQTATRLSPSNAYYHAELGHAYYRTGATLAAAGEYRSALRLWRPPPNETTKLWSSRARLDEHPPPARTAAQPAKPGKGVTGLKVAGGVLVGVMVVAAILIVALMADPPSFGAAP